MSDSTPSGTTSDFIANEIARYTAEETGPSGNTELQRHSVPPDPVARLNEMMTAGSNSAAQVKLRTALLDRHLASLREDFDPLMSGKEILAPYDRVESIVALFYGTLTDSYIGIDSNKPSEFWNVHPFLLDHLESSLERSPPSDACHGRRVVRIVRKTFSELQKDHKNNSGAVRKYMRWHADRNVILLRVDPGVAQRKRRQSSPAIWTTDIGLWPRTCALLFQPDIKHVERMKLQLHLSDEEGTFTEAMAYVKEVIHEAKELFLDGRNRLRERQLPQATQDDLLWSLEAIFEPGLANEWHKFVDPDRRMERREGRVILDLLKQEQDRSAAEDQPFKLLDAAMGVGSESVFLVKNGFDVTSNEIDWTLINHARRYAGASGVELAIDRYDWRHFEEKLSPEEFSGVLCLGNSLTCLRNPDEMIRALRGMRSVLRPGGFLLIDERNYRDMLARQDQMLASDFFFPGSVMYCGNIKATPVQILGASDTASLAYYDGDRLVGHFTVYCYDEGEFADLLDSAGFSLERTLWDLEAQEASQSEFVTYLARRKG